jgi:hypothetical protein
VTHLGAIVFLYQKQHPEDGRITGRNMLVKTLEIRLHHKRNVHLLVDYTFHKGIVPFMFYSGY